MKFHFIGIILQIKYRNMIDVSFLDGPNFLNLNSNSYFMDLGPWKWILNMLNFFKRPFPFLFALYVCINISAEIIWFPAIGIIHNSSIFFNK